MSLVCVHMKLCKRREKTIYLNGKGVNLRPLGSEKEESILIYHTYTKQGTKFGAMIHKELKRQTKAKMLNCSHSFFGGREKLT